MPRCRSCRAPIRWAWTRNGKAMPVDAEPNPAGNVQLVGDVDHDPTAVVYKKTPALTNRPLYMPHHATCLDAQDWRNP